MSKILVHLTHGTEDPTRAARLWFIELSRTRLFMCRFCNNATCWKLLGPFEEQYFFNESEVEELLVLSTQRRDRLKK